MALHGSHQDLGVLVADPEAFQDNVLNTVIVQYDHTPVWLKLRGEEKVCQNSVERDVNRQRAVHRRLRQKVPAVAAALEGLEPEQTQHLHQRISLGGDKYRLTLITFAVIQKWFQHDQSPVGVLPQYILIVPCSRHVRLEDVSPSGTWL